MHPFSNFQHRRWHWIWDYGNGEIGWHYTKFVLVVCAVLLIMGFFLESISMLLIMVPVLHPALGAMMLDPIWFGVLFVVMIECALISPPVGMNLFVIQAVAKVNLGEVVKGVWPFILMMFGTVVVIYLFPDIVLYIPFKL